MLRPILICSLLVPVSATCKRASTGDNSGVRAEGPGNTGTMQVAKQSYAEAFYLLDAGVRAGVAQGMGAPVILTFETPAGPKSCTAQRLRPGSPVLMVSLKCPFDEKVTQASLLISLEEKGGQPARAVKINIASATGDQLCGGQNEFKAIDPAKVSQLLPGLREIPAASGTGYVNPNTAVAYVAGKDSKYLSPGLEVCSDRKSGFDGAVVTNLPAKDASFVQAWKSVQDSDGISAQLLLDTRNAFFNEMFLPTVGSKNKTVEDPLIRPAEETDDIGKRAVGELLERELRTVVVAHANLYPILYPVRGSDQSCIGYGLEIKRFADGETVGFSILDGSAKDRLGGKKSFEIRDWKITVPGLIGTTNQKKYSHIPFVVGLFANQVESDSAVAMSPVGLLECTADATESSCEMMRGPEVAGPAMCPKLTIL